MGPDGRGAVGGADARDGVWQHPDLLPSASDLDEPAGFIDRMVGGDTSGMDSEIEAALADIERGMSDPDTDPERGDDGTSSDPKA